MRLLQKLLSLTILGSAALGAVVSTPACSSTSGTGGSGPGAVSSVDSSKTAGSLTETEAKQYCEDTASFSKAQLGEDDTKKVICGLSAALFAGLGAKTDAEAKASCTEQYNACLARPATTQGDGGATKDPCAQAKDDLKDCSATVSELNTCTADNAAALKALVGKDFCAEAKAASPDGGPSGGAAPYEQPASCKALAQKCPNLSKQKDG